MAKGLIQLSSKEDAPAPRRRDVPALTPRQLEVLKLLSEGKSTKEIGTELYLSQATVRNHVRALFQAPPDEQERTDDTVRGPVSGELL